MNLDETIVQEDVVLAVRGALGRPDLEVLCQLFARYGNTKKAILRLSETEAESLLKARRVKIGWVNCRVHARVEVERCFRCLCYGHLAGGCSGPDRKEACWRCGGLDHRKSQCKGVAQCIDCSDRGMEDTKHPSGSRACPVYWKILKDLKSRA
ncbi:uncharacterized protein LOC122504844 [Leptopilina heterotoma]|uniref:uncharacterized protein LOC122504844 n=1 Tax=Leptopilina heterotoma TaxID=63436 RepID=UPI001CAA307E|nr:uncharacterized protein LOC122504844 [Leptopilina heterotoma]